MTAERNGIGKDCGATVAHGEDAAGRPRANFTDDDGVQRVNGPAGAALATEATLATRATEATQALVRTATEEVAATCATDRVDPAPAETQSVAGKAIDPGNLPVDVAVANLVTVLTDRKGLLLARPILPQTPGAVPTIQQGVPGLVPVDWAETYDVGVVGTWHPRVNGVRIIETLGAGVMAATAVGRTVTISNVNPGVSTIANIIAAIAAAPTVVPLVVLTGAGVVGAAYGGNVGHDLEATGTIPATALKVLWPDGYWRPAEVDLTGGIRTSMSSQIEGEDATRHVLRVERQGTRTVRAVASGIVVAAGIAGRLYGATIDAGGGGITVNVRDDAVVGGAIIMTLIVAAGTTQTFNLQEWPYANGVYAEIAAGGGGYAFHLRNT